MNLPLKWPGGKNYLAKKIVELMPLHTHYVEPFAGGLAVLLAKNPEGVSEVVNDLNGELTNFWRVLQSEELFSRFQRKAEAIPFSEREWNLASSTKGFDEVFQAINFFVRVRQSLAGRGKAFAPLSRNRVRRGINEQVSAWLSAVEGLPEVHVRLKRVVILNKEALDVIREQDGEKTLYYLDPPYKHDTRSTITEYGEQEMSDVQHEEMLKLLQEVKGKVILSGYANSLYQKYLSSWTRHSFDLPNNAASGKTKRRMQEILWCNF